MPFSIYLWTLEADLHGLYLSGLLVLGFLVGAGHGGMSRGSVGRRRARSWYLPTAALIFVTVWSCSDHVSLRLQLLSWGPSPQPQLSLGPSYSAPYPCFLRARAERGFLHLLLPGASPTHICSCDLECTLGRVPLINAFQAPPLSEAHTVRPGP